MSNKGRRAKETRGGRKTMATWKKVLLIILIVFICLLTIVAGIGTYFVADKLGKMQKEEIDKGAIGDRKSVV